MSKIDGKTILERLQSTKKLERKKVSLYLASELYEAFMKSCSDVPASKVMEELMREFITSVSDSKRKK